MYLNPSFSRRALLAVTLAFAAFAAAPQPAKADDSAVKIILPSLWNEALDPLLGSGTSSVGLSAMYDDLVGAEADGSDFSKTRGIAEDWEMSPDGREWTLKIRSGIQFHRGFGELTAEDVKFSLERLTSERGVTQFKAFFKNSIDSIEVVDPYTVKITGKEPIPTLLAVISPLQGSPERFVVSKKAVEELGEDEFARNPVGSGPYEFVRLMGGQSVEMKAVENHWRIGKPAFASAWFLAVPEEETSIAMLQRGDADIAPLSRANVKRLESGGTKVVLLRGATSLNLYLDDQFADGVAVGDPRVREALNLAIDRQLIVDALFEGAGQPIGTYYSQTVILEGFGYDWKADLYDYDPARARELLAEAGYADGLDLDMYLYPWTGLPESSDSVQAIAGMWGEIGIRVNLIPAEYAVVRAKLLKGEMPGAVGYFPAPARPWQGMFTSYRTFMHTDGAFGHVAIPELDAILDAAGRAVQTEEAQAHLRDAVKFVREHHLAVPVLEYDSAFGVTEKVGDWNPGYLPSNLNLDNLFQQKRS